ncbi:MAG: flagellar biosynthesis anti-sigma factor FlgM [Agathobacter sp.]|nr:flagellar biosynthesis anti-sigma factor FlgM [Agathobacter sp.]
MRIDAYNQIAQLYGAQKTYNTQKTNKTASMGSDQLSISQTGYSYQTAKTAVSEASDVREDKVAKLKAQIQNGTYSVNPDDFANKLLEKYNAFM